MTFKREPNTEYILSLWALLLKWYKDSPVTFKLNGLTVHDYDKGFRWKQVNDFDIEKEVLYEIKA